MNLYAVSLINNFIDKSENNDEEIKTVVNKLNKKYMLYLIELLNKNENRLLYNLLRILINISYTEESDYIFCNNLELINKISQFIQNNKNNDIFVFSKILILKNMTSENNIIKLRFIELGIINYLIEISNNYSDDIELVHKIIICIGNFTIMPSIVHSKYYFPCILILKNHLSKTTNLKRISKYLSFLYNLSLLKTNEILIEMVKKDVHKVLMNIFPFEGINKNETQNLLFSNKFLDDKKNIIYYDIIRQLSLKIFVKLISIDEANTKILIDNYFLEFLHKLLFSKNIKIIKIVILCFKIICEDYFVYINKLIINGSLKKFMNFGKNIYFAFKSYIKINDNDMKELIEIYKEICYIISLIINNCKYEQFIPLFNYNKLTIILFLAKSFSIFQKDINLIISCLNALYKLVIYDKIKEQSENYDSSTSFSLIMDNQGISIELEKLKLFENEEINKKAEYLYNSIYSY